MYFFLSCSQIYTYTESDKPIPMKLFQVATMLVVVAMIFSACDKKEDQPASVFSFTFDGKQYVSSGTSAFYTDTVITGKKTLVIDGVTNNFKEHMQLMITSPDGEMPVGTYGGAAAALMPVLDSTEAGYIGTAIDVEITSINSERAEGTFHGTLIKDGETEKPLTDGTFKVNID